MMAIVLVADYAIRLYLLTDRKFTETVAFGK